MGDSVGCQLSSPGKMLLLGFGKCTLPGRAMQVTSSPIHCPGETLTSDVYNETTSRLKIDGASGGDDETNSANTHVIHDTKFIPGLDFRLILPSASTRGLLFESHAQSLTHR